MAGLEIEELREDPDKVLARLTAGETLTLTADGTPIGELRPLKAWKRHLHKARELSERGFADWDGAKPEMPAVPGVAPFSISDLVVQEREEGALRFSITAYSNPRPPGR
ncbi:MAG: hypothetical protein ACRDHF_10275 [Tepidiformaceae bacterium]